MTTTRYLHNPAIVARLVARHVRIRVPASRIAHARTPARDDTVTPSERHADTRGSRAKKSTTTTTEHPRSVYPRDGVPEMTVEMCACRLLSATLSRTRMNDPFFR